MKESGGAVRLDATIVELWSACRANEALSGRYMLDPLHPMNANGFLINLETPSAGLLFFSGELHLHSLSILVYIYFVHLSTDSFHHEVRLALHVRPRGVL